MQSLHPFSLTLCPQYLEENIGATNIQLSSDEIAEVRKIAKEAESSLPGERYAERNLGYVLVGTPELK